MTDWQAWHRDYDDPGSGLSMRRRSVQRAVEAWLDRRADASLGVVSACSGDGRDLLEVLARRPDRGRVRARLLETDPVLAARAAELAAAAGLVGVEVVTADAGATDGYTGAVPADLVMLCGVFGNITDADVRRTIELTPSLCAPGAEVVWTRGHDEADTASRIRGWFVDAGFEPVSFDAPRDAKYRVGVHRLVVPPRPFVAGERLFEFVR